MKRRLASAISALVVTWVVLSAVGTFTALPASGTTSNAGSTGTVIAARQSPYGKILTVASGQFAGYSVYLFNRDEPGHVACGTSVVVALKVSCTGAETDHTADWPAVVTTGKPVAGAGVNHRLLGSIYRKDLHARQVTYAGHPLYLFDMGPHQYAGENFCRDSGPAAPVARNLVPRFAQDRRPRGQPGDDLAPDTDHRPVGGQRDDVPRGRSHSRDDIRLQQRLAAPQHVYRSLCPGMAPGSDHKLAVSHGQSDQEVGR